MTAAHWHGVELTPAVLELAERKQWVVWRNEPRDGRLAKVPFQPDGTPARTNAAATWSSYADCLAALERGGFDGLGFVFAPDDPYVGLDLDHCLDEEGRPNDLAEEIVRELCSYAERSPSGRGLHLILRAKLPRGRKWDDLGVEVYAERRYFTMTGRWWPDAPDTIEERTEELGGLLERLGRRHEPAKANGTSKIAEGRRHNTVLAVAKAVRDQGLAPDLLAQALLAFNTTACDPPLAEAEVRGIAQWIEPAEVPAVRSYIECAPSRAELVEMAAAPAIVPLVTHLLYPRTTTVFAGQTCLGKTTATIRAGVDLVYGREPWTGRPNEREPRRVLVVSKDDTTLSLVRKVKALAPDDLWMDGRLALIGKEKRAQVLDDRGVEILGNTIADGRFDVFAVDPYQHFLPSPWSVNDDDGARYTVERLDGICDSLGVAGLLIHHPRKRGPKAKPPQDMTKGERLEEIRGSAVLAQLARSVATLWETAPGHRMLDAVVNDVPPLPELWFEAGAFGDQAVRWELALPPADQEMQALRGRFQRLEPGSYSVSDLARHLFEIAPKTKPGGSRRTLAKSLTRRFAGEQPDRFRLIDGGGVEVLH